MIRTAATGAKDITLGAASCIPIIGPCVIVPARFLLSTLIFTGKITYYGLKTVVMIPVKTGSAVVRLFHKTPKY